MAVGRESQVKKSCENCALSERHLRAGLKLDAHAGERVRVKSALARVPDLGLLARAIFSDL